MNALRPEQNDLHARLGYKPLNRLWAKLEILLGLMANGGGLFLGGWALSHDTGDLMWQATAALALFVLGGYLALAGHRSHLYQSNNESTASLAAKIDDLGKSPHS